MRDLMYILTMVRPKSEFPSTLDMEAALLEEMPFLVAQVIPQINEMGYLYLLDSDKYVGMSEGGIPMICYIAVPPERVENSEGIGVCTREQVIGYGGEPDFKV